MGGGDVAVRLRRLHERLLQVLALHPRDERLHDRRRPRVRRHRRLRSGGSLTHMALPMAQSDELGVGVAEKLAGSRSQEACVVEPRAQQVRRRCTL